MATIPCKKPNLPNESIMSRIKQGFWRGKQRKEKGQVPNRGPNTRKRGNMSPPKEEGVLLKREKRGGE